MRLKTPYLTNEVFLQVHLKGHRFCSAALVFYYPKDEFGQFLIISFGCKVAVFNKGIIDFNFHWLIGNH